MGEVLVLSVPAVPEVCQGHGSDRGAEVDDGLADLTFLGGDQDDAVSCLGTEDGRRGGVLQNVDLFDVVWIDLGEFTVEHHSVQDEQGIVVPAIRIDGTLSADTERAATLGGCVITDIQARSIAQDVLDGLGIVGNHVVRTDLDDGSCQVFPSCGTITDHDDIVQLGGVVPQGHVDGALTGEQFLADVADTGELKEGRWGDRDGKQSVQIGHGAVHRPFFNDVDADQRITDLVDDLSGDRPVLRFQPDGEHQEAQDRHSGPDKEMFCFFHGK